MPGDTVTISKESHIIAIKYGKNVSRGILAMQELMTYKDTYISELEEHNREQKKKIEALSEMVKRS